jgi:nicotinamidase-related amidase
MAVALLLVDLQAPFLGVVADGPAVLARARLAAAAADRLGLPVVLTEQAPAKLGPTEASLLAAAGPAARVFPKTAFSALDAPGLLGRLRGQGVDHLLIAGVEGPVCVHQTAIQALAEGLGVTLLCDALGARRPADQVACLEALARAGAHVLPVETVFYALLGGADHPAFRDFTRLVKEA